VGDIRGLLIKVCRVSHVVVLEREVGGLSMAERCVRVRDNRLKQHQRRMAF